MSCPVEKKIVRVKNIVAQKLEDASVESVASRLCNHTDVCAAITSIGSVVESCLNLELLNAVGIRNGNPPAPAGTTLYIADTDPIELEVVVIRARTMNENPIVRLGNLRQPGSAQPKFAGVIDAAKYARRQTGNLNKIPRDQRKSSHCIFVDNFPKSGTLGLHDGPVSEDIYIFENGCQLKVDLETDCLGDIYFYGCRPLQSG